MKRVLICMWACGVLTGLCFVRAAQSSVPLMINYQGTLTDAGGATVANGNYDMEFRIYDVASGGASLWSERWDTTTSQVPVVDGIFNVMLGFQSPIPAGFFGDHPLTYLGIKVGTDSEMLPRQQITSVGYAFTAGNGVPKGGIIMWSGSIATIPAGWALCDGNNGTPDLSDRFVVSVGNSYAVGSTGGEATHVLTLSEMPIHTHTQDAHTHGKTESRHIHNFYVRSSAGSGGSKLAAAEDGSGAYGGYGQSDGGALTGISINSATGTNQNTGSGAAHENRPPYFALAYIMKL